MSFVTVEQVKSKVKLIAEQLNFDLTSEQEEIITQRTSDAYNIIVYKLSNLRFTKEQIDKWASGAVFQSDIATYLSMLDFIGASVGTQETVLERYNREPELDNEDILLIDTDGNTMRPEGNTAEQNLGLAVSDIF